MKRLSALLILFIMVLSLIAGCQSQGPGTTQPSEPLDPNTLYEEVLTEEVKTKIKDKIVLKYDTVISWHIYDMAYEQPAYEYPYYGTINGCVIFRQTLAGMNDAPRRTLLEVADYTFEWSKAYDFYVYRNEEVLNLKEAYEAGWLTKEQIGVLHEKHSGYYAQWLKDNPHYDHTFDVKAYLSGYKNNIYTSLYQLDGEKYGRIISSSDSPENAVSVCTRHFTDNRYDQAINTVVECKVIYESDILYGLYVKWEVNDYYYEENVISFKKSVADITVENVIYEDVVSYRICTNQEEQIEQIVLYLHFEESPFNGILYYEKSSDDQAYTFTVHSYQVIGGDWGMPNEYRFAEQKVVVNKESGVVDFQEAVITQSVYDYYQE